MSRYIPYLGKADKVVKELFKLKVNEVSKPLEVKKGVVLFKVVKKKEFDEEDFKKKYDILKFSVLYRKRNDILEEWLKNKRRSSEIKLATRFQKYATDILG